MRSLLALALLLFAAPASAQQILVMELPNGVRIGAVMMPDGQVIPSPVTYIQIRPPVPPNPYPEPSAALKQAVQSIRDATIATEDARAFAGVFASAADEIEAGTITDLSKLDQFLLDAGSKLGLKGKYPGLADLFDKTFQATIAKPGDQPRSLTTADAAAVRAVAWALWR